MYVRYMYIMIYLFIYFKFNILIASDKTVTVTTSVSSLNNPNFGLLRNLARISGFFCTAKFSLRIRNISPKYRQNCFYR